MEEVLGTAHTCNLPCAQYCVLQFTSGTLAKGNFSNLKSVPEERRIVTILSFRSFCNEIDEPTLCSSQS
eukprot:scaffold93501_cov35-Attheya_sp.AAC.2